MEDAAADDDKSGDVLPVPIDDDPMSWTSFGDTSKPHEKIIGDAIANKGAKAPKSRISPEEMRMLIPAGGVIRAGLASTMLRTIFPL